MPTVLIVDDMAGIRFSLAEFFRNVGFGTLTAENGAIGLGYLNPLFEVDVIVLDLQMPVLDGYQFLDFKEASPEFRTIPVIVFSGEQGSDRLIGRAGVVKVFQKTTPMDELVSYVMTLSPVSV